MHEVYLTTTLLKWSVYWAKTLYLFCLLLNPHLIHDVHREEVIEALRLTAGVFQAAFSEKIATNARILFRLPSEFISCLFNHSLVMQFELPKVNDQ